MEKALALAVGSCGRKDPSALGRWYQEQLGITLSPESDGEPSWQQEAGPTVFAPFPEETTYNGQEKYTRMINISVRNNEPMIAQLRAAGIAVELEARVSQPPVCPVERSRGKSHSALGTTGARRARVKMASDGVTIGSAPHFYRLLWYIAHASRLVSQIEI